jgi:hypothetical protein
MIFENKWQNSKINANSGVSCYQIPRYGSKLFNSQAPRKIKAKQEQKEKRISNKTKSQKQIKLTYKTSFDTYHL